MTPEQMKRIAEIADEFALTVPIVYDDVRGAILAALADPVLRQEIENAAQKRNNLLACALRALLSKCPDCGGTGEVGTGIIQMGRPAQMPCFVCAGERQILLRECGK